MPSIHFKRAGILGVLVGSLLVTRPAGATRPLFEPTGVGLQAAGVLQVDTQIGLLRTASRTYKTIVPDLEIDLGLLPGVELDLDLAYSVERAEGRDGEWSPGAPENLWSAIKLGLYNLRDERTDTSWSLVGQFGPRIPTAPGSHGLGGEALLLFGRAWPTQHAVLNFGAAVDPAGETSDARTTGFETGLDVDIDLDPAGHFSFLGAVGGWYGVTDGTRQLHTTLGIGWQVTDMLTLSASWLVGFTPDGDRCGLLIGVAPRWNLWKTRAIAGVPVAPRT